MGLGKQVLVQVGVGEVFRPKRLETPIDRLTRSLPGRRSFTRTSRKRGRYTQSRPANGKADDLAIDATLRHAAMFQSERPHSAALVAIAESDWQKKMRVRRAANLILFVVDASWSMAAAERMEATKGAIFSLLTDAYQKRDRVGLVVFQKEEARLALPPTSSVELANRVLRDIPVGGKTPLPGGLLLAYRVFKRALRREPEVMPLMILLTDGAGNVSLTGRPAQEEAIELARHIRKAAVRSVVINMEHMSFDRGLAQDLADALGGPCYTLTEVHAQDLVRTVTTELASQPQPS